MRHAITLILILAIASPTLIVAAEPVTFFDNIEIIEPQGKRMKETAVRVVFEEKSMKMFTRSGKVLKEWNYEDIKSAEYSYTKKPRWKTGVGMGAAGLLFPPLLLIAIPVGFTKHRRHWLTIQTDNDFAVLKVGKGVRKIFMPTFETKTDVPIKGVGEDK